MKIAILGTAHSSQLAPFADESWEIWACSTDRYPRYTRWFELHEDKTLDDPSLAGHREWLIEQTKPLYMSKVRAEFPASIAYPYDTMREKFGSWFLTSTIAYMMALAQHEWPEEIALYGVEMAQNTEYLSQKPGCRFFIQLARMNGIKVTAPPGCEVMEEGFLYGRHDSRFWLRDKAAVRKAELAQRVGQLHSQHEALCQERLLLRGALEVKIPEETIRARLAQIEEDDAQLERNAIALAGALADQDHVLNNWC